MAEKKHVFFVAAVSTQGPNRIIWIPRKLYHLLLPGQLVQCEIIGENDTRDRPSAKKKAPSRKANPKGDAL